MQDGHGLRELLDSVCWGGWLEDAGLVPGYFFNGVAEHGSVIDTKVSNASDGGGDENVGSIIFASYAAFDYGGIDVFTYVRVEGHQCQKSEVGWFGAGVSWEPGRAGGVFEAVPYFEEISCKYFFGEGLVVDLDALAHEAEVGRGVEADFVEEGLGL